LKLGLDPTRADESHGSIIMEDVWIKLNEARIVIADITAQNPNVMYELGMAHVLGKPIILLISDPAESIPFDIKGFRHIIYQRSSSRGLKQLESKLFIAVSELLKEFPAGNQILALLRESAKNWEECCYDPWSLAPETYLQTIRQYLGSSKLSDLELAFCLATSVHYGSIDNMIYWGRLCKGKPQAARRLAHMTIQNHRRPKYRAARIIEQFSERARSQAIRTILEHGKRVDKGFIRAIRESRIADYVAKNAGGDLDKSIRAILLSELADIVI
jgi:hypothetical protein